MQVVVALGRAQAAPQAPQLAALTSRLVSQPFDATPSQSPAPALQRTTVQAPAAQPSAAVPASEQTTPQPPQLEGSFAVFAQKAPAPCRRW